MTDSNTTTANNTNPVTPGVVAIRQPELKFDATLSMTDLVEVKISETEEQLIVLRDEINTNINNTRRRHNQAEKDLTDITEKMVEGIKVDAKTKALIKALHDFNDAKDRFEVVINPGSVDVDKELITTLMLIRDNASRYTSTVQDKKIELKFSRAAKDAVVKIQTIADEITALNDQLTDTRRKLADLPRLARRCKAEITKAQLRGDLTTGQQMLDTVMNTQVKALPSHHD